MAGALALSKVHWIRPELVLEIASTARLEPRTGQSWAAGDRRGPPLIAAEKTGRVCRGIELDPLYVDVIIRRHEAATGKPAVLVETGEVFEALSARRAS